MAVVRTETFAPILYMMSFDTLEEGVALQNAVPYGLSSAIFSDSLQAAENRLKDFKLKYIGVPGQGGQDFFSRLAKLSDEKVKIRIIHAGVGAVNESDVLLASASNAVIIAFNVRPDRKACTNELTATTINGKPM